MALFHWLPSCRVVFLALSIAAGGVGFFATKGVAGAQFFLPPVADPKCGVNYHLQSFVSTWLLTVKDGNVQDNGDICQGPLTPKQVWQLVASEKYPGYFYICTQLPSPEKEQPCRFLDVYKANRDIGGRVSLAKQSPDQVWRLIPAEQPGYFHIESKISGLTLDVSEGVLANGVRVGQASKNPAQVWGFVPAERPEKKLLIVARRAFTATLAPFVAHKKKLLPTELVALETIVTDTPVNDHPEKLKRFLYDQWKNNGLGYVLLVGDPSIMPLPYRAVARGPKDSGSYSFSPVDWYYADLAKRDGSFDDWNAAKEGYHANYYGTTLLPPRTEKEPTNFDQIDYLPEVAVGRWPVRTPVEAARVAAKTMHYEEAVLADESPQVGRFGFVCADPYLGYRQDLEGMATRLGARSGCPSVLLFSGKDPKFLVREPSVKTVEAMLQRGVGLVFYCGHGSKTNWAGCLDGSRIRSLRNAALPPVMFTLSCDTGIFAPLPLGWRYIDVNGRVHAGADKGETFNGPPPPPSPYQPGENCLAVELLRSGPNGAVAYIGCAAGNNTVQWPLLPGFVQYLEACPEPRLGEAWMAAQTFYYKTYGFDQSTKPGFGRSSEFDQGLLVHLFGDPSLRLPCAPAIKHDLVAVDLQPWANQKLADSADSGNNLNAVPRGEHDFGGVRFTVGDKLIRVGGKAHSDRPLRVDGIKVDVKLKRLYFLHATYQSLQPGTVLGHYSVKYADGVREDIPIRYGSDVMDCWYAADADTPTGGMVAWTGSNSVAAKPDRRIRLYQSNWRNPRSDATVTSIDFISADTQASPFCVAITFER